MCAHTCTCNAASHPCTHTHLGRRPVFVQLQLVQARFSPETPNECQTFESMGDIQTQCVHMHVCATQLHMYHGHLDVQAVHACVQVCTMLF